MQAEEEEKLLRSVALQNAQSILLARRHAEQELVTANAALENKTAELEKSLSLVRATLDATSNGILATDTHGRITSCNAQYVALWRVPPEVMATNDHWKVLAFISKHVADPEAFVQRVRQIYEMREPEVFEVLELADGRVFERYSRVQTVGSREVGRVWSFTDVTKRRQAEEALRDETRLLEILNTTGTTLSSKLDLQSLLQTITDAATELSGAQFGAFFYNVTDETGNAYQLYTLSGAPREAFENFGHPRATPVFEPTFKGEEIVRSDDIRADPRYGKWAPHYGVPAGHLPVRSYLAVPVASRSGEVLGGLFFGHETMGVFTARTEKLIAGIAAQAAVAIDNARLYEVAQRSAEDRRNLLESERAARGEAERASAMKDDFLATLSHELRTPLSAILGWAQVLRLRSASEADITKGLETIERNARVQAQLIEDLLDMSRITSGKLRLDLQTLDPATFIEAAMNTVRPAAEAKGVTLESLVSPMTGPIGGDPARLQQVVWNLLSNSVKFTPKGGRVHVVARRVNSNVEISVSDTGIGIKPEFLPHVFDRFRQADASTTRTFGGLGLGLSIVKRLVELHGGTVLVRSAGENQGTSFVICLPLVTEPEHARELHHFERKSAEANAFDFQHADLSGVRILVVDDEPDTRELITRVLTECRATVASASNAKQALALFKKHPPDVLISDVGMPDVDGYELLKRIRALGGDHGARTPAIALTAFARSEDRTRALRAGFLVHVAKPVEPSELVATVASVAGRT